MTAVTATMTGRITSADFRRQHFRAARFVPVYVLAQTIFVLHPVFVHAHIHAAHVFHVLKRAVFQPSIALVWKAHVNRLAIGRLTYLLAAIVVVFSSVCGGV